MWVLLAFGSALFAGMTAILSKCGMRNIDSDAGTAVRTCVVLVFAWIMAGLGGAVGTISEIPGQTWVFLILSGAATGASWIFYYRALQLGDVNKVTPIDKSSTVLTMLLAVIFLGEKLTLLKAVCMALIGAGTFLMIQKKEADSEKTTKRRWILYVLLSAVFASLQSILGKLGIENVDSNLGTAIRTCVVLVMAWLIVLARGKAGAVREIKGTGWLFLILSGFATGASWLCYYGALHDEAAQASVVVPVDKLSIVVTVLFSWIFLKERLSKKAAGGLVLIVAGTLLLLL